ncbi:MAG: glycosyltransferase family 9 protein [Halarcobacter sp.]
MLSKLKNLIRFIIYYFINLIIKPAEDIKQKSLLLVRLDAIGDYILFRNYIEVLKKSEKYKDYSITLLGNNDWKNISEEFDSDFIDNFIWLDKNKFLKDFLYRYKKFKEIVSNGYEIVLSSVYSREFFYDDNIVKHIFANEKIGHIGDLSNIKKWQKNISDKYYDKLIPAKDEIIFEFYRNKDFFEILLEAKLDMIKPHIDLMPKKLDYDLPQNYAILFIGASVSFRKWSIEKFSKVGMHLKEKYNYEIVLCGGPSDNDSAKEFSYHYKGKYLDLVGKTTLVELLTVIYNGNLILSNETSAPHFAVALDVENIFVISNGNHYGRFTPYPKEVVANYHVIYHPEIEKDLGNYKKLINSYGYRSYLDINEISVETVKNKIEKVLNG